MKLENEFIYILIDAPSQGMRDHGVMGVYTNGELAEKAKGNRIVSVVRIKLNVFYNEGIHNLLIDQILEKHGK